MNDKANTEPIFARTHAGVNGPLAMFYVHRPVDLAVLLSLAELLQSVSLSVNVFVTLSG
jgi:hypothetical protein